MHVAIIMDGNGRWARSHGRARSWGHRRGADAAERVVRAAPDLGIEALTLYAFSSDNWRRPRGEVSALMGLLREFLTQRVNELRDNGARLDVIGRRDRLSRPLLAAIGDAERRTAGGTRLLLRIAIDYSARHSLLCAAQRLGGPTRRDFRKALDRAMNASVPAGPVDLVVRTGGDQRLSDFLLWESAYAELYFTPVLWPDFSASDLARAVADFEGRERRFGAVPKPARLADAAAG